MGGYNGSFGDYKNSLDEKADSLPKHETAKILDDDYQDDNTLKLETKYKHNNGVLKYNLTQATTADEKGENVTTINSDDITIDYTYSGFAGRFKALPGKKFSEHIDFGHHALLDGQVMTNPYFKYEVKPDLTGKTGYFGNVTRWNMFKHHMQYLHSCKEVSLTNLVDFRHGTFQATLAKKFVKKTEEKDTPNQRTFVALDWARFQAGYVNDKASAFLETQKDGASKNIIEHVNLHLAYECTKTASFALSFHQGIGNLEEKKATAGARVSLGDKASFKMKMDTELNSSSWFSYKFPRATLGLTFGTNHLNIGQKEDVPEYKGGYLNYPFHWALRLKVEE